MLPGSQAQSWAGPAGAAVADRANSSAATSAVTARPGPLIPPLILLLRSLGMFLPRPTATFDRLRRPNGSAILPGPSQRSGPALVTAPLGPILRAHPAPRPSAGAMPRSPRRHAAAPPEAQDAPDAAALEQPLEALETAVAPTDGDAIMAPSPDDLFFALMK